jgi:hypothetical protein
MTRVCRIIANLAGFVRIAILIKRFHLKESASRARIAAPAGGRYMVRIRGRRKEI